MTRWKILWTKDSVVGNKYVLLYICDNRAMSNLAIQRDRWLTRNKKRPVSHLIFYNSASFFFSSKNYFFLIPNDNLSKKNIYSRLPENFCIQFIKKNQTQKLQTLLKLFFFSFFYILFLHVVVKVVFFFSLLEFSSWVYWNWAWLMYRRAFLQLPVTKRLTWIRLHNDLGDVVLPLFFRTLERSFVWRSLRNKIYIYILKCLFNQDRRGVMIPRNEISS